MKTTANTLRLKEAESRQDPAVPNSAIGCEQLLHLVTTQYPGLFSLMRHKLKDRELASDLLSEAVVITLEHARLGRLTELQSVGGYVFRVCMNLQRNHQRNTNNRADRRADLDSLNTLASYDHDEIQSTQLSKKAQQLIESLVSPRDREVVKRFYLDEQDKQTICDDLGLTPLQFTQVMSRARQRMKAVFESQGHKRADFFSLVAL